MDTTRPVLPSTLLLDILNAKGRNSTKIDLEQMALELSSIAGKSPPWSFRYLLSVLKPNGKVAASKKLLDAMQALALHLDDIPLAIASSKPVQVLARPEAVRPGSVILGSSRPCINPYCKIHFVPWQNAHDPKCRPSYLKKIGLLSTDREPNS